MRGVAILGRDFVRRRDGVRQAGIIEMGGVPLACGLLNLAPPAFDPERQRDAVLLRIRAFSLNFRDRALLLRMATTRRQDGFCLVGSDFVAQVLAVGRDVTDMVPGDHVIPDGHWPPPNAKVPGGLPTNRASAEVQVLPRAQLMRIPQAMALPVAAAFTVGAQTACAMVRRLCLPPGARVLVTAAHSNTALFVLSALRGLNVHVDGASTHDGHAPVLRGLGLRRLVVADPSAECLATHAGYAEIVGQGGYDAVIDPLSDLYLTQACQLLRFGGAYITCGYVDQSRCAADPARQSDGQDFREVMLTAIVKNLTISGNCLGTTSDLAAALAAHATGEFPVVIDSVHRADPAAFLTRTYLARRRLGKVVFVYDTDPDSR